jgi:hypothetical protein
MLFGLSRLYTALIGGAVGLAIILGAILWHNHAVTAAYNRGKADEAAHVAAQAIALKSQVDTLSTNISTLIRSRTDAENDRISDAADALRLRGPGKATCPRPAGIPAGAGGRDTAAGSAGAAVDRVSYPEWEQLLAVPFSPTIDFAKGHDQCQVELKAYREWRKQLEALWTKLAEQEKAQPKRRSLLQRLSPF